MPNNIQNISFQNQYAGDLMEIERRRALAQALQQQSQEPLKTETAGGWAIPISPWQGAAKVAQAGVGALAQRKAMEGSRDLSNRYQQELANVLRRGLDAQAGRPSRTIQPDPQEIAQSADYGTPQVQPTNLPAVAPNPTEAASIYMQHPATQALGMQQMQQSAQMQALAQALRGGSPQGVGQSTQVPGVQAGGVGGNLPPLELLAAGDMGKTVFTTLADQNKPVAIPEGGALMGKDGKIIGTRPKIGENVLPTYDAAGNVIGVRPMPGAAEAAAGQAGAVEGAKAGYDLVDVPVPGGGTQKMTRANAAKFLGSGNDTLPANVPAEDGPAFKYVQDQARRGNTASAYGNSSSPMGFTPGEAAKKTDLVIGEGLGKKYNEIQDGGFSANAKINKFSRLGSMLEGLNTGKLAPVGYEIAAYAKEMGIPVSDKLDNAQAAKALANEMALELRNPSGGAGMPGAMSDADREYLRSMIAGIDKTPGANKMLIDGMMKMAERERDIARLAREYRRKNGGKFEDGFFDELQAYSEANPLFKNAPPVPVDQNPATASGKGLTSAEQKELAELRRRLGIRR